MKAVLTACLLWVWACGPSSRPPPGRVLEEPPVEEPPRRPLADREGDPEPDSHIVARNFVVAPGKFAEVNLELPARARIVAVFRADAPVEWNVHSHPEGGVAIHKEGTGTDGTIEHVADKAGGYSVLWKNAGAKDVNLIVSLEMPSGARIHSWVPDES